MSRMLSHTLLSRSLSGYWPSLYSTIHHSNRSYLESTPSSHHPTRFEGCRPYNERSRSPASARSWRTTHDEEQRKPRFCLWSRSTTQYMCAELESAHTLFRKWKGYRQPSTGSNLQLLKQDSCLTWRGIVGLHFDILNVVIEEVTKRLHKYSWKPATHLARCQVINGVLRSFIIIFTCNVFKEFAQKLRY